MSACKFVYCFTVGYRRASFLSLSPSSTSSVATKLPNCQSANPSSVQMNNNSSENKPDHRSRQRPPNRNEPYQQCGRLDEQESVKRAPLSDPRSVQQRIARSIEDLQSTTPSNPPGGNEQRLREPSEYRSHQDHLHRQSNPQDDDDGQQPPQLQRQLHFSNEKVPNTHA